MARGGLGVRKNLEQRQARSVKYQLVGVKAGSTVVECLDKYRRWELGYRTGVILRNSGGSVTVQWENDEQFTYYSGGDARYKVDTNLWRITPPRSHSPIDALTSSAKGQHGNKDMSSMREESPDNSVSAERESKDSTDNMSKVRTKKETIRSNRRRTKDSSRSLPGVQHEEGSTDNRSRSRDRSEAGSSLPELQFRSRSSRRRSQSSQETLSISEASTKQSALTTRAARHSIALSPTKGDDHNETREHQTMPEQKKDEKNLPERETYSAKQVATRIGTDAKTLRKFFRSPASTVEAVGQGGRYEFDKADMPKIKEEFDKWNSTKATRKPKGEKKKREAEPLREVVEEDDTDIELPDDPELLLDDEEEPTEEELEELDEDIDLDDEEDDEED